MINFKTLTVKNFMSVGNATQGIDLDRQDLTLVLGENLDLGGDGSRNGTGKTTILNALSYALFGEALTKIRKDNLINKTNGKNMLVSLEFEVGGSDYRIERGRKPNLLKFYVNDQELDTEDANEAQGDMRETQKVIEDMLGMSHEMFKHILALNTYTLPFLGLRANDQRMLIEQLLGITMLSERADRVKELMKQTKDEIQQEEFRIKAVQDANSRIEDQIKSLKNRQTLWLKKQKDDVAEIETAIENLAHINIDAELDKHSKLADYNDKSAKIIEAGKWMSSIESDNAKQEKLIEKLEKEIVALKDHKCYACGQELHDSKQDEILQDKESLKQEAAQQLLTNQTQYEEHTKVITDIGELGEMPVTFYKSVNEAYNHRQSLETLVGQLESRDEEMDPYQEQIEEMEDQAVQEVSYDTINELSKLQEHQDFLLKLLTNKDSFIRKKIIDQNLAYLNSRLTHYLDKIGLPHQVKFLNDLTVEITELGRDLDFDNLSRGERNRLILSMSWAFRDVWENLYQPINLIFIDELVDSGMDSAGVENSLGLLKKMARERNKSVWLISHRDELAGRVHNILKVIKENGFTSYSNDLDVV